MGSRGDVGAVHEAGRCKPREPAPFTERASPIPLPTPLTRNTLQSHQGKPSSQAYILGPRAMTSPPPTFMLSRL